MIFKLKEKNLPIDKKELFIFALKNPDRYTSMIFQQQWESLEDKVKADIIKKYKNNQFTTISDILILNKKISNAHLIMNFLLLNGFEFNKKDVVKLKAKEWLRFEKYVSSIEKPSKLNIFRKMKNNQSVIKIVELLNKDMVKVLANYFDKLPLELKQRVMKECDSVELLRIYEVEM